MSSCEIPGLISDGETQGDKVEEHGVGLKGICQAVHCECFFTQWPGRRGWHYSVYVTNRLRASALVQELPEGTGICVSDA